MDFDLTNSNLIQDDFFNISAKRQLKKEGRQERRREFKAENREEWKKAGFGGKIKILGRNVVMRYNPLVATVRQGGVLATRVNLFGISIRLYPAFLTPEEAKKKGIRVDAIEPAKKAWAKISKVFKKMGGNALQLEKGIKNGYNKPVFKHSKSAEKRRDMAKAGGGEFDVKTYSALGDYVIYSGVLPSGERLEDEYFSNDFGIPEATLISAGAGLISSFIAMASKSGATKNPYVSNPELDRQLAQNGEPTKPLSDKEVEDLGNLANEEQKGGLPLDDGSETKKALLDAADDLDGNIFGIPKTYFWIGVGLIAVVGGFFVYKAVVKKKG